MAALPLSLERDAMYTLAPWRSSSVVVPNPLDKVSIFGRILRVESHRPEWPPVTIATRPVRLGNWDGSNSDITKGKTGRW
jgi:hypothetical protein